MPPNLYIKESEGEKNENRSVSRCTWVRSERDMHSICDCIRPATGNTGHREKTYDGMIFVPEATPIEIR